MDAKKSDEGGEAHESGIKSKIVGAFVIAGLIAMAVFVGPAAADGNAEIIASNTTDPNYVKSFSTTNNVYAWGISVENRRRVMMVEGSMS